MKVPNRNLQVGSNFRLFNKKFLSFNSDNGDQLDKSDSELADEVARLSEELEDQKAELIEQATKHADFIGVMARLNQLIDYKETELYEQATKNLELSQKIDELEQSVKAIEGVDLFGKLVKLAELSTGQLDLGLNRKQTDFEFELNNVKAFLESKAILNSQYFFAGGLAWYLALKPCIKDEEKHLSIFLYAKDYADNADDWSIRAKFQLSIINQSWGLDSTLGYTNDFNKANGFGLHKFISIRDLQAGGYIRNDKIRVRARLKVVRGLVRNDSFSSCSCD